MPGKLDTGGPAFPKTPAAHEMGEQQQQGMTLRDYIATHALQALIASGMEASVLNQNLPRKITERAYEYADDMLALRARDVPDQDTDTDTGETQPNGPEKDKSTPEDSTESEVESEAEAECEIESIVESEILDTQAEVTLAVTVQPGYPPPPAGHWARTWEYFNDQTQNLENLIDGSYERYFERNENNLTSTRLTFEVDQAITDLQQQGNIKGTMTVYPASENPDGTRNTHEEPQARADFTLQFKWQEEWTRFLDEAGHRGRTLGSIQVH